MSYRRPDIPEREWLDADGAPIRYGERWQGPPPEDSYSRESNLERFAPLHAVADARIAWLAAEFDVAISDVGDGSDTNLDPFFTGRPVVRIVRVTPASPLAAPLTFAFTAYPGVLVGAGLLHRAAFPACGCDACDEAADRLVEELEQLVVSVVAGSFAEAVNGASSEYVLLAVDGSGGSGGDGPGRAEVGREAWAQAAERLRDVARAGGPRLARVGMDQRGSLPAWHPWPRRVG